MMKPVKLTVAMNVPSIVKDEDLRAYVHDVLNGRAFPHASHPLRAIKDISVKTLKDKT